jgi:hypothetical protein
MAGGTTSAERTDKRTVLARGERVPDFSYVTCAREPRNLANHSHDDVPHEYREMRSVHPRFLIWDGGSEAMPAEELKHVRVRREAVGDTIARLETFVARMERRYECTSDLLARALTQGDLRETAETAKWLTAYRTLLSLRESTSETGTATTATR